MTPPLWTPRGSHSSSLLPTALDRRTFLRGAGLGLAGLAGAALLGCSDDGGDESLRSAAPRRSSPARWLANRRRYEFSAMRLPLWIDMPPPASATASSALASACASLVSAAGPGFLQRSSPG